MLKAYWRWAVAATLGLTLAACSSQQSTPRAASVGALSIPSSVSRQLVGAGTTSFQSAAAGSGEVQWPEFPPGLAEGDVLGKGGNRQAAPFPGVNRRLPGTRVGRGVRVVRQGPKPKSNPQLGVSFDGLNLRDQRTANGGNQFTLEPPDQALCVGNGFVLESVNDVLRVYDTAGNPKTGVVDLNSFYGYPAQFNRTTGQRGPFVTDPVCHYDQGTNRFFHVVLTLDVNPTTGEFLGSNHLDLAVSRTGDPTGQWNIYRLPVQNDGTQGTPDHGNCPCIGDYPHIGADRNGIYLTTNEFPLFEDGFNGVQLYALSKAALAAGAGSLPLVQFDLRYGSTTLPAFTLWPAISPNNQFESAARGTEYFLSSLAVFEENGQSNQLAVWALTNTKSLDSAAPDLRLSASALTVNPYSVPPLATQKEGPAPLRDCLNDRTCSTFLLGAPDPFREVLSPLDASDSRILTLTYAQGKLWGALDTGISQGADRAGIAWYVLRPQLKGDAVSAQVNLQGYLTAPGNNVIYPTIAVNNSGRGVMGFTLVGPDYFPSAAYAGMDALAGVGDIQIAGAGKGPQDGATGYRVFGDPPRPRWGDYGAAATDGRTLWIANEYIAQTCTLAQYVTAPFGSCGGTRVAFGNWATRITSVQP